MPATSIGAARGALYDLQVAAFAAGGYAAAPVEVTYGLPKVVELEPQELVAMLGQEAPSEEAAALGGNRRTEIFDVVMGVRVYDPAGTGRSVDARAYTLVDTIRNTVLANKSLNQTVTWAEPVGTRSDGPLPVEQGWIVLVEVLIRCRGRN